MNLTIKLVSVTNLRAFIPEITVPSSITAYEGREMRFLITARNRGSLEGRVKLKLVPQEVALYGNVYFTSKKYAREGMTETEVFLGPGDTKYVVASVVPPINGIYTIKVEWEDDYGGKGDEWITLNVVELGGEEAGGMPGIELQHIFMIVISALILIGLKAV